MITFKPNRNKEGRAETELLNSVRGAMSSAMSAVSAASSKYVPDKLDASQYDSSKLANLGKSISDLADAAAAAAQEQTESAFNLAQDKAAADAASLSAAAGGLNQDTRDDDDDATGLFAILRMIFKIVPIGINVVKNTKTLAQGFKESALGLATLIKNLAITTIVTGIDSIVFAFELGYYLFKLLICSVGSILNLPKCILFYLFDLLMLFLLLVLTSILFMLDMFLGVKAWLGVSCVELLIFGLDLLEQFDQWVFSWAGAHCFHYPDFVINMCYRCSAMGDISGFSSASKKIFKDVFIDIPNGIFSPIGNIVRGIGHIFGFFSL